MTPLQRKHITEYRIQRIRSTCKECRQEADESMPVGLEELGEDEEAGALALEPVAFTHGPPQKRQKTVMTVSASLPGHQ
jgi:hypothetical protein